MSGVLQVEGVSNAPTKTNQQLASPEESAKIIELKAMTKEAAAKIESSNPEAVSDFKYLRFLRGYKGNVSKAAVAFQEMTDWRIENNVAEAVAALKKAEEEDGKLPFPYDMPMFQPLVEAFGTKESLMRFYPDNMDKGGNLLTSVAVGLYDLRKVVRAGLQDLLVKSNIYVDVYFELNLERLSVKNQRLVQRHDLLLICNPSIGIFQFSPSTLKLIRSVSMNSKHFPESIAKITSCGNNMVAVGIWAIIKPFVPKHTTEKISVFGTNFLPELLKNIDQEALGVFERYTK